MCACYALLSFRFQPTWGSIGHILFKQVLSNYLDITGNNYCYYNIMYNKKDITKFNTLSNMQYMHQDDSRLIYSAITISFCSPQHGCAEHGIGWLFPSNYSWYRLAQSLVVSGDVSVTIQTNVCK